MDRQKGKEPGDPRSLTSPVLQRLEVKVWGRAPGVDGENPPPEGQAERNTYIRYIWLN